MQIIGEGELELSQLLLLTSPKLRPQRQSQNRHRKPKELIKDFSQSPLFGGFFSFLGVMYYR